MPEFLLSNTFETIFNCAADPMLILKEDKIISANEMIDIAPLMKVYMLVLRQKLLIVYILV
ncbi:MAG TPA: hypothetical protein EYO73_03535 [Sulfurimonas sp.]|nr:hypothetical protein [Sulfurimonas sp.]